jgi:hypothetical protein
MTIGFIDQTALQLNDFYVSQTASNEVGAYFTLAGNDTVSGGSGSDTFNANYIPGFDAGTTDTNSITGGGSVTIDFAAGANAGQDITTSNVQSLVFLDGTHSG